MIFVCVQFCVQQTSVQFSAENDPLERIAGKCLQVCEIHKFPSFLRLKSPIFSLDLLSFKN